MKLLIQFVYNQDKKIWSKCYHSFVYPVTNFVHVECNNTSSENTSTRLPNVREEQTVANSTLLDSNIPQRSGNKCTPRNTDASAESHSKSSPSKNENSNTQSSTRNPDTSVQSQSKSCPRNADNCKVESCPRNRHSNNEGDAISSRVSANVPNECNAYSIKSVPHVINKQCITNSCSMNTNSTRDSYPRFSTIVTNECHENHCPRNPKASVELRCNSFPRNLTAGIGTTGTCCINEEDVGNMSHIPRTPPTPATYTIPTLGQNIGTCGTVESTPEMCPSTRATLMTNLSFGTTRGAVRTTPCEDDSLFGMIALKNNDVCYTSGTIEWVGRKRSYPLNTGFKVIKENCIHNSSKGTEAMKKRKLDRTFTVGTDDTRECDCTDMLPTVNAIVDHLNALHEAVDLVDLRLSNLEETL